MKEREDMMDCRTASDLMMKYLDGEADADEEKLLFLHLEVCDDCRLEFRSLKDTFSMLDSVEMEDAPEDLEYKVICRITADGERASKTRKWVAASAAILAAWIGIACLILFTPFVDTLISCAVSLLNILNDGVVLLGRVFSSALIVLAKMLALVRAFGVTVKAVVDMYGVLLAVMVLFMAVIFELCRYMLKDVRR